MSRTDLADVPRTSRAVMARARDPRCRNEAEHQRALRDQRDQLVRLHEVQLRRLRRDHDDDLRRVRQEAR